MILIIYEYYEFVYLPYYFLCQLGKTTGDDSGQTRKINTSNEAPASNQNSETTARRVITWSRFYVDLAGVGIVNEANKLVSTYMYFKHLWRDSSVT